jgi:autotransporter family porin
MDLLLLGTFHERQGDQYLLDDKGGAWARLIGAGFSQKLTGILAPAFDGTIAGVQAGSDVFVTDNRQDRAGLDGVYAHSDGLVRGTIGGIANLIGGYLPTDMLGAGGYYTHIAPSGWYIDAVVNGTWFNSRPLSINNISTHISGNGITASLEGGYPVVLDEQYTLEPMAQIVFNSLSMDDAVDPYSTMSFHPASTWFGRLGARLEDATTVFGSPQKPYLEADVWHGFGGTDTTVYNGVIPLSVPFGNTDAQFAVGTTAKVGGGVSLIARVSYTISRSSKAR